MGSFLLCKRFVTGGHGRVLCRPEAEFTIATEHRRRSYVNVPSLIVTFEAPALYGASETVTTATPSEKNHRILLLLVFGSLTPPDRSKIVSTDKIFLIIHRLVYFTALNF